MKIEREIFVTGFQKYNDNPKVKNVFLSDGRKMTFYFEVTKKEYEFLKQNKNSILKFRIEKEPKYDYKKIQ